MITVPFHPDEQVIAPPPDRHKDMSGLRVLRAEYEDGSPILISCWGLTDKEKKLIAETGRVYLAVMSASQPPVLLTPDPEVLGLG